MNVTAPFAGTVIAIGHEPAEPVRAGAALVVLEAMKMEHEVVAESDGVVERVEVAVGDTVDEGQLLAVVAPGESDARDASSATVQGCPGSVWRAPSAGPRCGSLEARNHDGAASWFVVKYSRRIWTRATSSSRSSSVCWPGSS